MTTRSNRASLVLGALLIGLGLLFLAQQFLNLSFLGSLWPFIVIAAGGLFFLGMLAGGPALGALAIPGSIISMIGLILLVQNAFGLWESWSYAWGLLIVAVGIGLYISGRFSGDAGQQRAGWGVARTGLILFIIFGALFELVIFDNFAASQWAGPLFLILLGIFLLARQFFARSGRPAEPPAVSASSGSGGPQSGN